MLSKYLEKLYIEAQNLKERNIKIALGEIVSGKVLLDLGSWDGEKTLMWKCAMRAKRVVGLEIVPSAIKLARKRNIKVFKVDIDKGKWPLANESVDCVNSNLVIEHVTNVDHFMAESYRVLKKGGYTIVTTNNLSSWHNIISLFLGWTPFDLANSSSFRWAIGNPLAIHKDEGLANGATFTHKCIYTIRWLKEWYELYGFKYCKVYGAGYYPFPAVFGNWDKKHCAFFTLIFKK